MTATNARMLSESQSFPWAKYLGLCEAVARRTIERQASRLDRVGFDRYAVDELTAEAVAQIWLHLPAGLECYDWVTDELVDDPDHERSRACLAAYRAARAVLSGHWLATRPIDSIALARLVGRLSDDDRQRLRDWRTVTASEYEACWRQVWRDVSKLGAKRVRVAHMLCEGLSVRQIAERCEWSKSDAGRQVQTVQRVVRESARKFSEWRLSTIVD